MKPNKKGTRRGAKDAKGTMKRLLSYIFSSYKKRFILVLVCILVSSAASVAASLFLKTLVDDYIEPMLAGARLFGALFHAVMLMCLIYIIGVLTGYAYQRIMVTISQGVLKKIRDDMFSHMQTLPIKYFDTHTHGDVMSRYTNDTDTLMQLISQSIPMLTGSLVTIVVVFISMLVLSFRLSLIVVLFIIIQFFVAGKLGGRSSAYFVAQQKSLGRLNGFIEEMISGQKVVKVFCREERAKADFKALNDELCENAASANIFANILMPIMGNIGYLLYVTVAIAGGLMALGSVGGLTLGTIISFLQLSRSFSMPFNQASQQLNFVAMALAGAERIFALLDEKPEEDGGFVTLVNATEDESGNIAEAGKRTGVWAWKYPHGDGTVTYTRLCGDVRFFDVDFSYEEGKPVLHDVSLYAKPGQKLAFVGATGAGKTTITNLINRFYDIEDGKIRYDGININKIKKPDLRRSLGVVLQDVNLFTGTVMENIRYGNLDASDEDCVRAAKRANAHDFISMLPQGYETVLTGGGADLSQGQRQLLSIARAAVSDPPVMILDEATSSIDTRTEALVQRGMDALMENRTVFVIAHRLSTVMNSKAIIVLENGRIIERGSHEQLIEQRGKYYQLYTGAFELE